MPYVAHVGIRLKEDANTYKKDEWHQIKTVNGIEYRWRLKQNLTYEVISGLFVDRNDALIQAKQIYVTLLYSLIKGGFTIDVSGCDLYEQSLYSEDYGSVEEYIKNEPFFFWDKKTIGGQYGLGVYEVDSSIDEFDEYNFFDVEWSVSYDSNLDFDNVDEYIFTYSRKSQELLNSVILAEKATDYGMKMTIYCGILEHLSEDGNKSEAILNKIDDFINCVDDLELEQTEKDQLKNYLNGGKKKSSRQRCKELIKKYAKPQYGKHKSEKIFSDAYGIRSTFSHGDEINAFAEEASRYIKFVVLDVIKGYIQEKEKLECQNNQQQ